MGTFRRIIHFYLIGVSLALVAFPLQAFSKQDSVLISFDFSLRQRFEIWNGMNARNYGDDSEGALGRLDDKILMQRIIAGFTVTPSDQLTIAAHILDSRAFGWSLRNSQYPDAFKVKKPGTEEPYYIMNPSEEFLEIYDAYIEYKMLFKNVVVKLGRQKIFYGDNHIFGPGDWGNSGRWTWDALKVSWKKDKHFVDVFGGGTKIHDPEKLSVPFLKTEYFGGGMYARINIPKILNIEPFYANKFQGSADFIKEQSISWNWIGLRLVNENIKGFIADGTIVKQFGSENGRKTSAYGYFAKLGYKFSDLPAKPVFSLRQTYATGGSKNDDVIRNFNPAYGASDKYYGWMNIVSWSNLDNREINLELYPAKNLWLEIKYNRFIIPFPEEKVVLGNLRLITGEDHLGDEFDILARFTLNKHLQFIGAFSCFLPGKVQPINGDAVKPASWLAFQVMFTL